jgi:hypothetical protein
MTFPVATKRFVIESANVAKTNRTRHRHDVLPLLVPLQNLNRELLELASCASVLKNLPHAEIVYTIFSMSIDARKFPGLQTGRLTSRISGGEKWRTICESKSRDTLSRPLHALC